MHPIELQTYCTHISMPTVNVTLHGPFQELALGVKSLIDLFFKFNLQRQRVLGTVRAFPAVLGLRTATLVS